MTNCKISNPVQIIKSILSRRKRQKIYLAHLETAIVAMRMKEEMNRH